MKFTKEFLLAVLEDNDPKVVIANELYDKSRWSCHYQLIFKHEDKIYSTTYSSGATEYQDERPFEYAEDEIECPEMVAVPSIKYVIKK